MNQNGVNIIDGDLLDYPVICQQCNSVTTRGKGLSHAIFAAKPWADIYSDGTVRVPGNVYTRIHEDQIVYNLVAQKYPGKSRYKNDTNEQRLEWFKKTLKQLHETKTRTFYFPYKIGCGLAGGYWPDYLKAIKDILGKDRNVIIVRKE